MSFAVDVPERRRRLTHHLDGCPPQVVVRKLLGLEEGLVRLVPVLPWPPPVNLHFSRQRNLHHALATPQHKVRRWPCRQPSSARQLLQKIRFQLEPVLDIPRLDSEQFTWALPRKRATAHVSQLNVLDVPLRPADGQNDL